MYDRSALIALIRQKALSFGQFTLASGKQASFYLDCRQVTLDSAGAHLIAEGIYEQLEADWPEAVGGMAIGADPVTAAVITIAHQRGRPLSGFIVRKEPKAHGRGRDVEGPVKPGQKAIVLEDVVTTGGSSIQAIERARAFGLEVQGVIAVIDRLEGGQQTLAEHGCWLKSLLTIRDFGIEPE